MSILYPDFLKEAETGKKVWAFVAALVGGAASIFVGAERGLTFGAVAAGASFVAWLAFQLVQNRRRQLKAAIDYLGAMPPPVPQPAIDAGAGLAAVLRDATVTFVVLGSLAALAVAFLVVPTLLHSLQKATPKKILFATLEYRGKKANQPRDEAAFVEAVVADLHSEGVGQNFRVVQGTTEPFAHPTPEFKCSLHIDQGTPEVAGYAFRLYHDGDRVLYEPLRADYSDRSLVVFTVPASEQGDRIFVVARLVYPAGASFPVNLTKVASLSP